MKRGRNSRETCDLNGWGPGTILRGHEEWANGKGAWSTIRITAVGETSMLGRCIRHERTQDGEITDVRECNERENTWTLAYRDWTVDGDR